MDIIRKGELRFEDLEDGETFTEKGDSQIKMKFDESRYGCLETGEWNDDMEDDTLVTRVKTALHILED